MTGPVLFRVDAGPGIGLGHLQRCLALSEAFGRLGTPSVFVVPSDSDAAERIASAGARLAPRILDGVAPGDSVDSARVVAHAQQLRAHAVVVDSYAVENGYLLALRRAGIRTIYLDDLAHEPLAAQLVVNGGVQATRLPYASSTGDTQFLLGPTYALLRPREVQLPRQLREDVRQILITVGGDDRVGALPVLIDLISMLSGAFDVVVAVGPYVRSMDAIDAAVRRARRSVRVVRGALGLREIAAQADLAVSAAGQTVYELLLMGTPTIALETAENQHASLAALADQGLVESVGAFGDAHFADRLTASVNALLAKSDTRRRLSETGQRVIDGCGADRVAAAVAVIS